MNVKFNVTGSERKALVESIASILGQEVKYQGAPSFAYTVSEYHIDKDGTLSFADDINPEELEKLLDALRERGYQSASLDCNDILSPNKLSIQVPTEGFTDEAIENLRKIIASKETLIKKALKADNLPVNVIEDKLDFPWFTEMGVDGEYEAYMRFVVALCDMAKNQKRITAKEKTLENDKFTMRLFLIRLGFIGPECKTARAILLRNLMGNSSFKNGQRPEKAATIDNSEVEESPEDDTNTQS